MALLSIALEEQFMSSNARKVIPADVQKYYDEFPSTWIDTLLDVAPDGPRLQAMDSGNVTISVLSNVPGFSSCTLEANQEANNELAAATQAQPRYKAFASLPMKSPSAAATELERCVTDLHFAGALIDSHLDDGTYYDGSDFHPIFAKAASLDVPIYIHPTSPTPSIQAQMYDGNYSSNTATVLGIAGWGWHADTALSLLRLYGAGLFEELPDLKIVIGHMGEMLPFMLERIDQKLTQAAAGSDGGARRRSFREVWERNVWVTTSGMFELAPFACLLGTTKVGRILYSVDYPWSTTGQGREFLERLGRSGLVSEEDLRGIAYGNAENLLKFKIR